MVNIKGMLMDLIMSDMYSYTKINLDMLFEQTAKNRDTSLMKSNSVARGRGKVLAGNAVRRALSNTGM